MQLILARFVIGCLFLTLIHGASLTAVHSNRTGQNRNFLQFGYLIWGAAGNPFDYNGYGCWCGAGRRGDLVLDETDRCCQIHDMCWGLAEEYTKGCKPMWKVYDYSTNSGEIQCKDEIESCERDTCLCDKAAVECFARYRSTTYLKDHDNWKGICEPTVDDPEDDPDYCPPRWQDNIAYKGGSRVNVNGIAYQAFYWAEPGQNPKSHSSIWQSSESVWQKLGPCRVSYVDGDLDSAHDEAESILATYYDKK